MPIMRITSSMSKKLINLSRILTNNTSFYIQFLSFLLYFKSSIIIIDFLNIYHLKKITHKFKYISPVWFSQDEEIPN